MRASPIRLVEFFALFFLLIASTRSVQAQDRLLGPPVPFRVDVGPDGVLTPPRAPNTGEYSATFWINNTGTNRDTYGISCAGTVNVTCTRTSDQSVTLDGGTQTEITAFYSVAAVGSGRLTVTAEGEAVDAGYYTVPVGQYSVAVTPDGDLAPARRANTSGHTQAFTVRNTGDFPNTFSITCGGSSNVTCTGRSPTSVPLNPSESAGVTAYYDVGGEGLGTLTLSAAGTNATDGGSWSIPVERYAVAVTPDGTATPIRPTSATWSDTFTVRNAGTAVTGPMYDTYSFACSTSGPLTCGLVSPARANISVGNERTVTVNYSTTTAPGTGTLELTANGVAMDQGHYSVQVERYGVAVRPDGQAVAPQPQTSASQKFAVENTGSIAATYNLTVTCTGTASGCTAPPSITVQPTTLDSATVTYQTGSAGTTGRVRLLAVQSGVPSVTDSGWVNVSVGGAVPPSVDVATVNPGAIVERDLCLAVAAGPSAAAECGDLRIVHPLPTTRTLNKARTPTLLYNSAHAEPFPLLAANVTIPTSSATPDSVVAKLLVGISPYGRRRWPGWAPGVVRRIVVADTVRSFGTGVHTYNVEVTSWFDTVPKTTAVTAEIAIVDRRGSPFGAGWWLAGLERLSFPPGGGVLWVGGDGSVRRYQSVGADVWAAPNVDRPDTVKKVGAEYVRALSHGVKVKFDLGGKHVATVNRLGHRTDFAYDNCGRLSTITLPPANSGRVYTFTYSSASDCATRLQSVTAPPAGAEARVTMLTVPGGRITTIRDPDLHSVGFGYDPTFVNRINSRTDRRLNTTFYAYDAGGKVTMDSLPLGTGQTPIVQRFRPIESLGLVAAIDTAVAYTRLDGPRVDVADTTAFWLDRFGAPRRIVNALGHSTVITRGDARWPALATRVREPNGRVLGAVYDERGNVVETTDSSHFEDRLVVPSCHEPPCLPGTMVRFWATTRYAWDPAWDFVTKIRRPEKDSIVMSYNAANGNRLWQQLGSDPARRVTFAYYTSGLEAGLLRATQLADVPGAGIARDSIVYDTAVVNLAATRTPLGYWTLFQKDALGRDTAVVSPLDSADTQRQPGTFPRALQRTAHNSVDRDTLSVSIGPAVGGAPAETLFVRKYFNANGQVDSLLRWSRPDTTRIGIIRTSWRYDAAGRPVAEFAPDHTPGAARIDSTYFDPAGNAVKVVTRRGDTLTMQYDALNRLQTRTLSAVRYPQRLDGIPKNHAGVNVPSTPYPMYPNDGSGYLVPADVATFTYDTTGGIRTANNGAAQISRGYYPNGALKADTQRIRTMNGSDFNQHRYILQYSYDLDGRRVELIHPPQLAAGAIMDRTSYTYDPATGLLAGVTDLRGTFFQFGYDLRGQLRAFTSAGGISETYDYDSDGRLRLQRLLNESSSLYRWPESYLRDASYGFHATGRIARVYNRAGTADTLVAEYSGLGHLARDSMRTRGEATVIDANGGSGPFPIKYDAIERFTQDGFANAQQSFTTTRVWAGDTIQAFTKARIDTYRAGVGRVVRSLVDFRVDTLEYDKAGNTIWMSTLTNNVNTYQDRASYYGADGKLVAADRRSISSPPQSNFEESRYDALGRRVWVRSRNNCAGGSSDPLCRLSKVRRIVWDGPHELYEIQMPGSDADGTWIENDTAQVQLPVITAAENGLRYDRNPYFGRVAYTTGHTIDQPLSVIRFGYRSVMDQNGNAQQPLEWAPFAVMPRWTARGLADIGTFEDGGVDRCTTFQGVQRCIWVDWPAEVYAYARNGIRRNAWHGSVLEDKRDAAGTLYRRNRLYDPATGRFTQEDPIGLAGGLNLYGFANGDPVTFSDPFGLKADTIPEEMQKKLGNACSVVNCNDVTIKTEPTIPVVDALILAGVRKSGRALTYGNTIYMPAQPDPENSGDVATVAHELVHVYQFGLLEAMHGNRAPIAYLGLGAIDQARYSLGLGNPYTGGGFLEPMAQRVQNCFQGGSCVGAIFTPTGP